MNMKKDVISLDGILKNNFYQRVCVFAV